MQTPRPDSQEGRQGITCPHLRRKEYLMTTVTAATSPRAAGASDGDSLPRAVSLLAVTTRPGQESADLGGLLFAFRRAGASLSLLCLTRGEAAAQNSTVGRLEAVRPRELRLAAAILGIGAVTIANYRDGQLHQHTAADLTGRIHRAIREQSADMLLVIAPEAGDRDDTAVARAATAAGARAGIPVVARTRPGAPGAATIDLSPDADLARAIQKSAAAAHTSQSAALPALIRRLDLLDGWETLRWLLFPQPVPAQRDRDPLATTSWS
jgi:LmbE family N-acetylglucosaminyl deacetylase